MKRILRRYEAFQNILRYLIKKELLFVLELVFDKYAIYQYYVYLFAIFYWLKFKLITLYFVGVAIIALIGIYLKIFTILYSLLLIRLSRLPIQRKLYKFA